MIHIVLYQPEIPPNCGNIIRLCFATNSKLHIIKPTSFLLTPKWLKRAAAGKTLEDIQYEIHPSYEAFCKKHGDKQIFYLTRYGLNTYSSTNFSNVKQDLWFMFGRESTGIPKAILRANHKCCLRIPMTAATRSLNLANTVAIVLYEVLRQQNFLHLSRYEVQKGKDWLWQK